MKPLNDAASFVCTLGEKGLLAMDKEGKFMTIPAEPVRQVVDTIGAGDCFIAGLIHAHLQRCDFNASLRFANRLAASKVQRQGMNVDVEILI